MVKIGEMNQEKVMLVIDDPKCCKECRFCHIDTNNNYLCYATDRITKIIIYDLSKTHELCPLNYLPMKCDTNNQFAQGYNDCLQTILSL